MDGGEEEACQGGYDVNWAKILRVKETVFSLFISSVFCFGRYISSFLKELSTNFIHHIIYRYLQQQDTPLTARSKHCFTIKNALTYVAQI